MDNGNGTQGDARPVMAAAELATSQGRLGLEALTLFETFAAGMRARVAELEAENAALRARLAVHEGGPSFP